MPRLRQFVVAEVGTEIVLDLPVAGGSSLVLTKVFVPGRHDERLDELVRVFCVSIDGPVHCACPASQAPHVFERREELLVGIGPYVVRERD